jgi:hypothetical protein
MLADGVKGYAGKATGKTIRRRSPPRATADEAVQRYGVEQERLVDKLNDQDAYTVSERADGKKLIKQLEDLQYRWTSEFMRLQDNYRKRKISLPEFPYVRGMPQIRPAAALVATTRRSSCAEAHHGAWLPGQAP